MVKAQGSHFLPPLPLPLPLPLPHPYPPQQTDLDMNLLEILNLIRSKQSPATNRFINKGMLELLSIEIGVIRLYNSYSKFLKVSVVCIVFFSPFRKSITINLGPTRSTSQVNGRYFQIFPGQFLAKSRSACSTCPTRGHFRGVFRYSYPEFGRV